MMTEEHQSKKRRTAKSLANDRHRDSRLDELGENGGRIWGAVEERVSRFKSGSS